MVSDYTTRVLLYWADCFSSIDGTLLRALQKDFLTDRSYCRVRFVVSVDSSAGAIGRCDWGYRLRWLASLSFHHTATRNHHRHRNCQNLAERPVQNCQRRSD